MLRNHKVHYHFLNRQSFVPKLRYINSTHNLISHSTSISINFVKRLPFVQIVSKYLSFPGAVYHFVIVYC